ncbi:MAG: sulfate reduction electron transfer complex DsrMKJOP subunit DsrJ [bacterium]|nr:sulfate reduction electron transfer complex DsrMKJOP subunit DsrJ [bacterium]
MRDRGRILIGLLIFLILMTFPVWYNALNGVSVMQEPELATKNVPGKDKCVNTAEYMRQNHMNLLNQWRDTVVRQDVRVYTTVDGRKFNMSLTNTCLDCHPNRENFCNRCHNYLAVNPYCWDCHVDPQDPKVLAAKEPR